MSYVPTSVGAYNPQPPTVEPLAAPSTSSLVEARVQQLATIGYGAYGLAQGGTPADYIGNVYQILSGIFATTALGTPLAVEGLVYSTLGKLYEKHLFKKKQKKAEHRAYRRVRHYELLKAAGERYGLPDVYAARAAAARIGVSPEAIAPLGSQHPFFNPMTRAVDSPLGLAILYGHGPEADELRRRYAERVAAELAERNFPGEGLTLQPFARRRKS